MFNRRGAFLYKIETDETDDALLKKMTTFARAKKIDLRSERPWRGFMSSRDNTEVVASVANDILYAAYGFEFVKEEPLFNGEIEKKYDSYIVSVIADPKRRILAIQTSHKNLNNAIFTLLQEGIEDSNYIRLTKMVFPGPFLKWLVDNSTKKSSMFKRVSGVKVDKLQDYDNNLNDAVLHGDDAIGSSKVYKQIKDNGRHKYIISVAQVDKSDYPLRIYDYGQITVRADEGYPLAPVIPAIAEELSNLLKISKI